MRRHPEIYDEGTRGWLAQRLLRLRRLRRQYEAAASIRRNLPAEIVKRLKDLL